MKKEKKEKEEKLKAEKAKKEKEKIDKQNENTNNNLENKTIPLKKNKIKCISKVNNINNQEGIKPSEMKSVDDIKNKKETSKKKTKH